MKATWKMPRIDLDLEKLWDRPSGPRWKDEFAGRLESCLGALKARAKDKTVGFLDWPSTCPSSDLAAMRTAAERWRKGYDGVLCIGIGGSYLGPSALQLALRTPAEENQFPIHWLSNVDEEAVRDAVSFCESKRVAAVVISKSGGTTETLAGFFHLSHMIDPTAITVITDPQKGELRRLARENQWQSFDVPPNIGGRFSVLTSVGLFPAFLGGIDGTAILQGAREMHDYLDEQPSLANPAALFALASFLWDTGHGRHIQYLMPYGSRLEQLGDWYVQLWAESLGKKQRGNPSRAVGATPVAALGTSDQHSILQLLREGPGNKVVGFLDRREGVGDLKIGKPAFEVDMGFQFLFPRTFAEVARKASLATEQSLNGGGCPTYRLSFATVDAPTLGAFFQFFETACAIAGELYGVDTFDQPGVEEAKRLLRHSL